LLRNVRLTVSGENPAVNARWIPVRFALFELRLLLCLPQL
jgi:hypothetical protein